MGLTQIAKRQKNNFRTFRLGRPSARIISAVMAAVFGSLIFSTPALAAITTKPYFKTYGADVFTGGWYNAGTNCDTATNSRYQDPTYSDPASGFTADNRSGGILSFAKENGAGQSTGGASSQYGAFSLGIIEGSDPASYGFYSAGALSASGATSRNLLTFANNGSSSSIWGGTFDGSVRQSNCIPDYYSKLPSPAPPGLGSLDSSTASGSYSAAAGGGTTYTLNSSAVNLKVGTKITVFVNGNVYISQNIIYQLDRVDNVPKFAVVAKGNIYIDPNVTRLDGVYIAQPNAGTDGGDIWTCHANNTDVVLYTYPSGCTNPLVVNGSLIGKRVEFLRVKGDVASASTAEDGLSSGLSSTNVAEIINYSPAMVVGGPFFNPAPATGLPIDNIIALPPVF